MFFSLVDNDLKRNLCIDTTFDRAKLIYLYSGYPVFQDYQIQLYISSLNYGDVEKCVYIKRTLSLNLQVLFAEKSYRPVKENYSLSNRRRDLSLAASLAPLSLFFADSPEDRASRQGKRMLVDNYARPGYVGGVEIPRS